MGVLRVSHVGICVADLERSLRFYQEGFGFERVSEVEVAGQPAATLLRLKDVKLRAVFLERDGVRIELLHFATPDTRDDPARSITRSGLTHLSFRVDDLENLLGQLTQLGGRVREDTNVFNPQFDAGAVFIEDPDGTPIELLQQPGDPSRAPGT